MIVLFNGHSLAVRDRFQAEAFALQLSERQSTATLTISDTAPAISVDNWLMAESGPGARIVWRVRAIDEQFDRKTRTVQLEHTIQTLKDRLMFGEVTSKTMGGSDSSCSARSAVSYVLRQQADWRLGDFAYNVNNPYNFNGDDLLSALETISGTLEDCVWEYDFSSYPFMLHIRRRSDDVASEMRMDRNIRTLKKTIDRSRMYTRIYPIGKNNMHIDGNYLSKNEDLYGIVCKTETDQSQDTQEKLRLWAQERLDNHCEPAVTVTISGLELADATGEPLDSFKIGKICRVPLPEFSSTITERVSKLNYPDVIKDPENVTITLANELIDVATIIKQQNSSSGRGGRAAAKNDEEKHAWIIDEQDHVGLLAEAVAGPGADKDWSRVSEILVDGKGIHERVTKTEGDIVVAEAKIEINENEIRQEVTKRTSETSSLSSRITQEAGRITQEVTARVNGETALSSRITQTASEIRSEVSSTAAGLSSQITQTASAIRSEVSNTAAGLASSITQTASEIRSEVSSTAAGLESSITQTAGQIRSEVSSSVSGLQSSITQTAGEIRQEVSDTASGLSSRITQNADKVAIVVDGNNNVKSASIVAGINGQSGSYVKISADKVNLDGYVTTSMLESAFTSAQQIATEQMTISQYFTCLGYNVEWKEYQTRRVTLSSAYNFRYESSGTSSYGTVNGRIVTGYTDTTLYYLGR